jgi:steroid delta-isomerase-like uncharacterized protein
MAVASPVAENIERSERFVEQAFNARNLDIVDELVADDYVTHDVPGAVSIEGKDAYRDYIASIHAGFSDLTAEVETCFGQDDLVCTRTSYRGTHDGEFMGVPATGKSVAITGTTITRIEDGKMVETWANVDTLGLLQQVGVVDIPTN